MRTVPRVFIITSIVVAIGIWLDLPDGAVSLIGMACFAFLLDVLFEMYGRHQEALLWFLDNVHITDKPMGESDAPESLKKLLRKEEDKKND